MFDRITSNVAILGGKPIIRGTRISVELILEWIASGATRDEILHKHPQLVAADIEQALYYVPPGTPTSKPVRSNLRLAVNGFFMLGGFICLIVSPHEGGFLPDTFSAILKWATFALIPVGYCWSIVVLLIATDRRIRALAIYGLLANMMAASWIAILFVIVFLGVD